MSHANFILDNLKKTVKKLTPMMEQYHQIKKNHIESILFFRMGDFYEVFFEDAERTAKALNIAQTFRGKIGDYKIPMAGIPHHAANTYIDKLTAHGFKVAICEQVEDPKMAKGIVKRAVTQIVSPCLPYDLNKANESTHHFIAALSQKENFFFLTFLDFTTGDFLGVKLKSVEEVIDKIRVYQPKELIAYFDQFADYPEVAETLTHMDCMITYLSLDYFNQDYHRHYIEKLIPFYDKDITLQSESHFLSPISALSYYVSSTQSEDKISHIKAFKLLNYDRNMKVTFKTLQSLEIYPKSHKDKNCLIYFIDKTLSSMGRRKLNIISQAPLYDKAEIESRYDLIDYLKEDFNVLKSFRASFKDLRDIERILAKLTHRSIQGFDLINLARAVEIYEESISTYELLPTFIKSPIDLASLIKIKELIFQAISPIQGAHINKGNLIKEGYSKKRDELANINEVTQREVSDLEQRYRSEFDIPKLRIKSNNVNGFFIEISKGQANRAPEHFKRKQTLTNSERYTCEEVTAIENKVVSAEFELRKVEREIFEQVCDQLGETVLSIQNLAEFLSYLDVFQGLTWLSLQENFTRPSISSERKIQLEELWHPLVKNVQKDDFVSHNISLNEDKFFGLITGPNMAGKTTVMREVAITQYLAQLGCFVPTSFAEISLCDYLFSRIGASDDIVSGQSTFMVEMSETSEILRHSTSNSLVILDEIGRGTSTYDGLSIAWSLVEYFCSEIKSFTLFSTHYHELIEVVNNIVGAQNFTVKTINKNGEVKFLYELIERGATQSFGIHVAKLAGLPKQVLNRANFLLKHLEDEQKSTNDTQMDLLDFVEEQPVPSPKSENLQMLNELKELSVNDLTPLQALNKLNDFKSRLTQ